jgi:hypothetical protein
VKYVFFVKIAGEWCLATRNGNVLTTTDVRELLPGSPVVNFYDQSTVATEDIYAQVNS